VSENRHTIQAPGYTRWAYRAKRNAARYYQRQTWGFHSDENLDCYIV